MNTLQDDKAGKAFWDKNWSLLPPELLDLDDHRLRNEINLRFHELFCGLIDPRRDAGKRLLEVGCARSVWLPYFARQHGLRVAGLDYSEEGCKQSEAVLASAGVQGDVHCADMFQPPADLLGAFDYLFTLGVIEHFTDTAGTLAALAKYMRPGGRVMTVIPNMRGSTGALQQWADSAVFETHVPLDPVGLAKSHTAAGLLVERCDYFIATNYYVVNALQQKGKPLYPAIRAASGLLGRASMGVWQLERLFGRLPAVQAFSPYVICIARSP